MKQQPSPLEILEFISLAGTAAGTVSVILLSQQVGYAIGPGAFSLVLGAANRRLSKSGSANSSELVQIDQKLSADLASVRQQLQGLPSSSDYNSLKSTVQNLSNTLGAIEPQKPAGQLSNVGVELNPIRQDIVQLRSQYGNLQDFLAQLRDRIETLPPPDKLQTIEKELKQLEAKLAQLPSKFQKMSAQAGSADLTSVTAEIAALKEQLQTISSAKDLDSLGADLQGLKHQVQALENTADRLVVETQNLAEKEEVRSLVNTFNELQKQQEQLQATTANDHTALTSLGDRLEALHEQLNRIAEEMPASGGYEDLQELQQRFQELKERFELRMSISSVEVKDGETIELTGVEDALAKIAEAVSEVKLEMDSRMASIESVELKMIQEQLLAQQETLTGLQKEYQSLLASTSESNNWTQSLSESEYSEKIASLERALANTSERFEAIESSLSTNGSGERELGAIDSELSMLAAELEQLGSLKTTVSHLATNLESLETQVQSTFSSGSESITEELRQEIDALKESLDAIETSVNSRDQWHQVSPETATYPFIEINILSQEIEQIGILKDTVYQLSGNVEILDQQVHALATGSPDSMTGQLKEQMDELTAKVEQLPEPQMSGDSIASYETVMLHLEQRVEQVETAYLSLEEQINQNQDLSSRNDQEITDQLSTFNTQLCDLQQEIGGIGQKLIDLEQGIEGISVSELEATRQDVSVLQATVSDWVNRLENDGERTQTTEKVEELAEALSALKTKLSQAIAELDDGFHQLQLQTAQLATEQAQSQATTSQIETLIGDSIDRQMGEISQLLQDVAPCDYELVFDRPQIQECIATTIENSQNRLIIVCPWLNRQTISGLFDKLEAFLERNGQLQIGWGHLADINAGEFPLRIHSSWETEALTNRRESYDALNDLEALREKYPNQVEYKVLGTHENFLVSDRNLALISSHHFLSSDGNVPEREVAIKTSSLKIIQGLVDRFQDPVLKPGNADAYYNRGFERLEIGDYEGAMEDYRRALEINPHQSTIYNNLGLAKYHGGDLAGAIADYSKAIEVDDTEPVTYFNRAVAYYKLGDYRKSISDYTQVIQRQDGIRISAENTGAYFQRAEAYRQLGEYDSAISDYAMAIRLAPTDPVAYNNRGLARYNQGDYLGSIQDYSEALALNPDDGIAYSNRGVSRLKSGDYAGAVADFDRAIKLKADYASAYNNRGLARMEMGDRSGAIADLEKAAELFGLVGNLANQQQTLDSLQRLGKQDP